MFDISQRKTLSMEAMFSLDTMPQRSHLDISNAPDRDIHRGGGDGGYNNMR
jgi:hypothetical protein